MTPFQTREFKRLFNKWNKILNDNGHKEIEDFKYQDPLLKKWETYIFKSIDVNMIQTTTEYYDLCVHYLQTYDFKSQDHKEVFRLHTEGNSVREIAELMNKKKFKKSKIADFLLKMKSVMFNAK